MGQAKACTKAPGGNGLGLRKSHGPNTGGNRDHLVVRGSANTGPDAFLKTVQETVKLPTGRVEIVETTGVVTHGISVKPAHQEGLLALKAQQVSQAATV